MGGDLREGGLSFLWKVSCFLTCCAGLGTQGVWRGASSGRQAYGGGECSGQPWGLGPQAREGWWLDLLPDAVVCPWVFP